MGVSPADLFNQRVKGTAFQAKPWKALAPQRDLKTVLLSPSGVLPQASPDPCGAVIQTVARLSTPRVLEDTSKHLFLVTTGDAQLIYYPTRLFRTEVHCHTLRALQAGI